jgi:hypothetical protein
METNSLPVKSSLILFYGFVVSILLLIVDYVAGPFIQFPVLYLIPVALLSWFHGRRWGLILAIVMPLVRLYFNVALWTIPWTITEASLNAVIRILVLSSFALIIDRTAIQTRKLSSQVSLLEGLLPICSYCKKIRDQKDEWQVMERYITDRSAATFTHGICPDCMREHFGHVLKNQK